MGLVILTPSPPTSVTPEILPSVSAWALRDMRMVAAGGRQMLASPQVIAGLGTEALLDSLRDKLIPEKVGASNTVYYFEFTDTGEKFTLTLRNGILDVVPGQQKHDVRETLRHRLRLHALPDQSRGTVGKVPFENRQLIFDKGGS